MLTTINYIISKTQFYHLLIVTTCIIISKIKQTRGINDWDGLCNIGFFVDPLKCIRIHCHYPPWNTDQCSHWVDVFHHYVQRTEFNSRYSYIVWNRNDSNLAYHRIRVWRSNIFYRNGDQLLTREWWILDFK